MRLKIKIAMNGLFFVFFFYKFFYFESDLNALLFWTLVVLQVGVFVFVAVRKYWSSIIKLNVIPVLLIAIGYFIHGNHDRHFEESWERHWFDQDKTNVKVSELTSFKWDKMYMFRAYMSEEDINRMIGQHWARSPFRVAPLNEGQSLVLFLYKGRVSHDLYIQGYWDECSQGCSSDVVLSL
jgi:hypothetical protein